MPIDREKLIGLIYDGIRDGDAWGRALRMLAELTESAGVGLGMQDMISHEFRALGSFGIDDTLNDTYKRHAGNNHVWRAIGQKQRPMTDRMVMPKQKFSQTGLYREWFVPQRFHSVMAAPAFAADTTCAVVVAFRNSAGDDFSAMDLAGLEDTAKHFGRALSARLEFERLSEQLAAAQVMHDGVNDALVLVDRTLRPQSANRPATLMLKRGDTIRLHDGRLQLLDVNSNMRLHRLMQSPTGGIVPVRREARRGLILRVLHDVGGLRGREGVYTLLRMTNEQGALITPEPELLRHLLEISAGDARTICALMRAGTEAKTARLLRIAPTTVHENIQRVYAKTDLHTRGDLMALLARYGIATNQDSADS